MAGTLGNNTNYVSKPEARKRRYRLQDAARALLPDMRVGWCMMRRAENKSIELVMADHASYRGLITCGSVWTCPVCASRITERRRVELRQALETNPELTPVMVTMTLQHSRDDSLAELLDALRDSWRRLKSGRWWISQKAKYRIVAYVTSLEFTYSQVNGWHPHLHALLFCDMPERELGAERLKDALSEHYTELISQNGRYASQLYGLHVRIGDAGAADYVHKFGLDAEIAKSSNKMAAPGGYTPFQLLQLFADGSARAGVLFCEYARVTLGRKHLTWSKGGRQLLGLGAELTDEQLAALEDEVVEEVLIHRFTSEEWRAVIRSGQRCTLLELAEAAGLEAAPAAIENWLYALMRKLEVET